MFRVKIVSKRKEDVEGYSLRNIQENMKQLANDSEKYREWMLNMHQDIVA